MTHQPPTITTPGGSHSIPSSTVGGRFDFDDGGVYIGGWLDGKAHGHGVCTGPKSQGEYSGSWNYGFELSGVYRWPSGATYEGQWQNGKRHGIGVEYRGKWVYKGEWTQGYKGRYGVRASLLSAAKYEGTWANGLQDGYGSESYADGGTYQGQWLRGMRHGYGVRQSAAFGHCNITKTAMSAKNSSMNVSMQSLSTDIDIGGTLVDPKRDATMRGGFVLVVKTSGSFRRRNSLTEKSTNIKTSIMKGLRLKKQRSAGDVNVPTDSRSHRSSASVASSVESSGARGDNEEGDAVSNASFLTTEGDIGDPSTTETYIGEWKNDKRCGFGICERSDGVRYEGEWYNNKKYGYGVTTFRDGAREEGKYKNNQLVTSIKKKHLFVIRSAKTRERIDSAVQAASRAQQIALQKADIAISRTATARGKAEQADVAASTARTDSVIAFNTAKTYGGGVTSSMIGSDSIGMMSLIPDSNMSPLRRRLSDFSSIRRGTKESLGVGGAASGGGTRQYLDPNVPFGGRRGSFRSDQTNPSLAGVSHQQQQPQQFQQQKQYHQGNVPRMSFEPPTPQIPPNSRSSDHSNVSSSQSAQFPENRFQQQPPSSHFSRQPAPPPPSQFVQTSSQQVPSQQVPSQRLPSQQLPSQQLPSPTAQSRQSQQQYNPNQGPPISSNFFYQQSTQMQAPSQQQQLFNSNRKQSQPLQPYQSPSRKQQLQPSLSSDSFTDHFDHYSYRTMMTRYGSVPRQTPIPNKRRSRTPLPAPGQLQSFQLQSGQLQEQAPRVTPVPPSHHSPNRMDQLLPTSFTLRPSPSRSFDQPLADSAMGSVNLDSGSSVNLDSVDRTSHGSNLNDLPPSIPPRGAWRTSSLARPSPGPSRILPAPGLRRKPSVQPSTTPLPAPVISREEASILSHNQRQMLRSEAEMSERIKRNPFLFFLSPTFRDWLSRKKLMILVLFINLSLALLFYQLFG